METLRDASSGNYSIRVVARLTGVSADKLRIWERRYGFPSPNRRDNGSRVYSDAEVDRLRLIARALEVGYRAGDAVRADPTALRKSLESSVRALPPPEEAPVSPEGAVDRLLDYVLDDDPNAATTELRKLANELGPQRFVVEVASPAVERVGAEWRHGRLAVRHEHLFSTILATELRLQHAVIDEDAEAPVVLFTTLPGENHSLGLEMTALYMAGSAIAPRLLGVDTPTDQIVEAALALEVSAVGISISTAADISSVEQDLLHLRRSLPANIALWAGGAGAARVVARGVTRTVSWLELDRAMTTLKELDDSAVAS